MSDHYIGLDLFDLENNGLRQPISRITLYRGDNAALTAGDDTGLEVVADCIYVTQEMVEALLSAARGYQYHAYSAQAARLNPAAELGDTVEVGSIVSVLAQISDHGDLYPDIAAPGDKEVEDEYPAAGPLTKAFDKKLAEARSELTKTTDQIALAIYGEDGKGGLNGKMATFTVSLSTIGSKVESVETKAAEDLAAAKNDFNVTLKSYSTIEQTAKKIATEVKSVKEYTDGKVSDLDSAVSLKYSTIEQTDEKIATRVAKDSIISEINQSAEEVQISASKINLNGYVTFSSLSSAPGTGQTKINGGWVDADTLVLKNKLTFEDFTEDAQEEFMTEAAVTEITKDTIKTVNISANRITSGTLNAGNVALDGLFKIYHGNTLCGKIGDHYSLANGTGVVVAGAGNGAGYMRASSEGAKVAIGSYEIGVFDNGNNAGCFSTHNINVNSDRRLKANINYQLTKEEELFMKLRPCSFELKNDPSKKKRWGFIAQDVIAGAKEVGMDSDKLAFIAERNGLYSISYGELTAINTHMIQKLMNRVAKLEAQA